MTQRCWLKHGPSTSPDWIPASLCSRGILPRILLYERALSRLGKRGCGPTHQEQG